MVLIILFILFSSKSFAQDIIKFSENSSKQWTIDECVNTFNIEDTIGTNVGYQYWFFDKDFIRWHERLR